MTLKPLLLALVPCLLLADAAMAGALPVVSAVGADSIAVKGVNYKVPAGTRIVVDDLPSKLSDVRAGMLADIEQGLDQGTAESIVAATVPPKAPPSKAKTRSLYQGGHGTIVIAITAERITYGVPGTEHAHAAFLTPQTRIYVAGHKMDPSEITVGMLVEVSTTDGQHADTIRVDDASK